MTSSGPARWTTALLFALALAGCGPVAFDRPGLIDGARYGRAVQAFAEFCALSQIKQRPGFGAGIRGDIGGHAVLYLHGACRARERGQTTLRLCDDADAEAGDGVGLSMNAHFRSAKWVAVPGRDFFLHGGLAADAPLTEDDYRRVQATAKRLRLYDGIDFHDVVFTDRPPDTTAEDWRHEVSIGTDYGIGLARGRFCARVSLERAQLAAAVAFLNAENAPYRDGNAAFHWNIIQDNCIHLAHNALAAAGVWPEWRTRRPFLLAALNFPVPRNEFVNLMRRTGDTALLDPGRLHADAAARRSLLEYGVLPVRAGAVMESRPPQRPNALYETDLKLVFYDEPVFGPYQGWFDAIQDDPRRSDPDAERDWLSTTYARALAARRPLAWWLAQPGLADRGAFPATYQAFYALLEREAASLRHTEPGSLAAAR